MDEYRKIEITQPGIDADKPVPDFKAGVDDNMAVADIESAAPAYGAQDLNMFTESDGEDF